MSGDFKKYDPKKFAHREWGNVALGAGCVLVPLAIIMFILGIWFDGRWAGTGAVVVGLGIAGVITGACLREHAAFLKKKQQ